MVLFYDYINSLGQQQSKQILNSLTAQSTKFKHNSINLNIHVRHKIII